jgi:hypothetical protein
MAALCAGDMLRVAGHPAHVVGATLTALKSRLVEAGPVALRDMDALCIKGWSKMRPCLERAPYPAERQQELKINVKVWDTKDP